MEITYIAHSGFLMEWDNCYFLFDYYKGVIPELDANKQVFVFASHVHEDHFNPLIYQLADHYPDVTYVLSSDIKIKERMGISPEKLEKTFFVKPYSQHELMDQQGHSISLKTLKSTDSGVAFLLKYQGKTIYHAGDLNLWVWEGETKQYNNNMTALFNKEMETLKGLSIDVAFAPLDPRQEMWYDKGMEQLLNTAKVKVLFPMHFQDQPEMIQKFKREKIKNFPGVQIMDILQDGQKWTLEI